MSSCVIDESALSLIPVTATPSTSSARAITSRPGVAAVRLEDQATPPSAAGTSVVPAEHIVAKLRRHQLKGAIPARRAATLRCACQTATLAHLRARFDLATHSKTPAARLGSAARKAGSHLWLPPRRRGAISQLQRFVLSFLQPSICHDIPVCRARCLSDWRKHRRASSCAPVSFQSTGFGFLLVFDSRG